MDEGLAWFFETLHRVAWQRRKLHDLEACTPQDEDTLDRLARARLLLERRYHEPLRLDDLAKEACYSRFHFLRLFQAAYGETPGRFLQQRRMAAARALLRETELSVTDVSGRVGFRSLGTFSRTFREETGLAPAQYRKRLFRGVQVSRVERVPACFLRMVAGIAIQEKTPPPALR